MNVTSGIGDREYERRRDDRATECPYRVRNMVGDELYIECGYDGEHRLCVEEYDPANPCTIHWDGVGVEDALGELRVVLGKGLYPTAIPKVREILTNLAGWREP